MWGGSRAAPGCRPTRGFYLPLLSFPGGEPERSPAKSQVFLGAGLRPAPRNTWSALTSPIDVLTDVNLLVYQVVEYKRVQKWPTVR